MSDEEKLPQESLPQQIGHYGYDAFCAAKPLGFRARPLDGDDNVGLDVQVQVVDAGRYVDLFFVQLKAFRASRKSGLSAHLSAEGSFYSYPLGVKNVNYYRRIGPYVLLLIADLTRDSDPRRCPVFWRWIDNDCEELSVEGIDRILKEQETLTFRIPVANRFTPEFDPLPYLESQRRKREATQRIFKSLREMAPNTPDDSLHRLETRLFSPQVLSAVLADPETPWIEAPKGTFQADLAAIDRHISEGNAILAREDLERSRLRAAEAPRNEQAEYRFQWGRVKSLLGDNEGTLQEYEEANSLLPGSKRYHVPYLYEKLTVANFSASVAEQIISEVSDRNDPAYLEILARTYALIGRRQETADVLDSLPEDKKRLNSLLIPFVAGDFEWAATVAERVAVESLKPGEALLAHIVRAKSLFHIGLKEVRSYREGDLISFAGLPGMDSSVMREAWKEVKQAWVLGPALGYPESLELVLDVSGILGFVFNDINAIYQPLKNFAAARPGHPRITKAVLVCSLQLGDSDTADQLLAAMAEDIELQQHALLNLAHKGRKRAFVRKLESILPILRERRPWNYDVVLAIGADFAGDLFLPQERDQFLNALEDDPRARQVIPVLQFTDAIKNDPLTRDSASERLYEVFEAGNTNPQVLAQLIRHLDVHSRSHAERMIRVAEAIRLSRLLDEGETRRLCQALATIGEWPTLVEFARAAKLRFRRTSVFAAIEALAVDMLGETPSALEILETIDMETADEYTFELYASISARCGFSEKAVELLNRLLERATDRKVRLAVLHNLAILSIRLGRPFSEVSRYVKAYGGLCDRRNEAEESTCLLGMFAAGQVANSSDVTEADRRDFNLRLESFISNFPNSQRLRAFRYDEEAPPDETLRAMQQLIGLTEERLAEQRKRDNLIRSEGALLPFAVRPSCLSYVGDLLQLFQACANGAKGAQYKLALTDGRYQLRSSLLATGRPVLVDDLSLLVLHELGVLGAFFEVIGRVAVFKHTILRFQYWSQRLFGSPFYRRAQAILDCLRDHVGQVWQLTSDEEFSAAVTFEGLDEYRRAAEREGCVYYSEDFLARAYAFECDDARNSACIFDLVDLAESLGVITPEFRASTVARLAGWNTVGVHIRVLDVLRVAGKSLKGGERVVSARESLEANLEFQNCSRTLWSFQTDFKMSLLSLSRLLSFVLRRTAGVQVEDNIAVALWLEWFGKARLALSLPFAPLWLLGASMVAIATNVVSDRGELRDLGWARRLWSWYLAAVEHWYGSSMSEELYRESILQIADKLSKLQEGNEAIEFLFGGLSSDTKEGGLLNDAFIRMRAEREEEAKKSHPS